MKKVEKLLKSEKGEITVWFLAKVSFFFLLGAILLSAGLINMRMQTVKIASQNMLDTYTVKIGREIVGSVKSGNDYTPKIKDDIFKKDLQKNLKMQTAFQMLDENNAMVLYIDTLRVNFIYDKLLKTHLRYKVICRIPITPKFIFEFPVWITQEARYELKY